MYVRACLDDDGIWVRTLHASRSHSFISFIHILFISHLHSKQSKSLGWTSLSILFSPFLPLSLSHPPLLSLPLPLHFFSLINLKAIVFFYSQTIMYPQSFELKTINKSSQPIITKQSFSLPIYLYSHLFPSPLSSYELKKKHSRKGSSKYWQLLRGW